MNRLLLVAFLFLPALAFSQSNEQYDYLSLIEGDGVVFITHNEEEFEEVEVEDVLDIKYEGAADLRGMFHQMHKYEAQNWEVVSMEWIPATGRFSSGSRLNVLMQREK